MAGEQEGTEINHALVVASGIAILASVAGSMWLAVHLAHGRPNGPPPLRDAIGEAPRFGVLEQRQFNTSSSATVQLASDRAYLETWGWLDNDHRHAHLPIARAEQLLLAEQGGADAGGR